jgi:DNA-binding NarL/FixJ family response regulator
LREGIDIGSPPIILNTMVGIAELFIRQGDLISAVRLATIIINHPASPARTKERTRLLLMYPEARFFSDDLEIDNQQIVLDTLDEVAARLVEQLEALIEQPLVEPLSERELEVLRLMASGKSNREIARELTLTLGTIKSHIHHIMQKLDASNRTDAVTRAREYRLL